MAAIAWFGAAAGNFGDARDYTTAARAILAGAAYPRESSLPFFRAPLYPAFMALVFRLGGESYVAVKLAQALLLAVTCGLACRLGLRVHGSASAALAAGLILAVDPLAVMTTVGVQTETLHMALVTSALLLTVAALSGRRPVAASFAAGASFGLASLARPSALPVAVAVGAGLVFLAWRERRRLAPRALFFAGLAVAILPWTVANARATGSLILITDAAGYHFWLGNNPEALRLYRGDFASRAEMDAYGYRYLQKDLPARTIAAWERTVGYASRSLREREALWREEAWRAGRADPLLVARLWVLKAWAYWRPWLQPVAYSPWLVLASGAFGLTLYALALRGALRLSGMAGGRGALILIGLLLASSTAIHVVSHSMVRFRIPYVDPALAVLAGLGVVPLAGGRRDAQPSG